MKNNFLKHKLFLSQFHPEAAGGPADTEYLFDEFIDLVRECK